MSIEQSIDPSPAGLGRRLTGLYARTTLWYLLGVAVLWLVGIEGIYGSPTPFYAALYPAFGTVLVPCFVLLAMRLIYLAVRRVLAPRPLRRDVLAFVVWLALAGLLALAFAADARMLQVSVSESFATQWLALRWHLLALIVFVVFFGGLFAAIGRLDWFDTEPSRRVAGWFLVGLVAFACLFAGAIAMLRNGPSGISQAYERHGYEYISDIGMTSSIRTLFRNYTLIRPYLSMHAKVHPPGPIALLWLLSYVIGQEPMGLSLATMVVGALGLIPLYLWAADLAGRRVALTCCVLYSVMPSIVLFTATSADILFTPFSLLTLFLFWRALHRRSPGYAVAAGAGYAVLSLLSFSLLSLGAFFACVALWRFREAKWRRAVIQTAAVMILAFLGVHLAVRWWSGFDVIACFHACRDQFYLDQVHLDEQTPRFASWLWKFANPACWFFFAGIPVSVLFVWRLARPESGSKALFLVFACTLLALDLLYLGRGEGERSAMYILPFVALPAAHLMEQFGRAARSHAPLAATVAFLAFQCWLIESYLYTFW